MNKDRWQKVKKIFETANGLATEERGIFLDKKCGDDSELRAEIEKLLNSFEEVDTSFLEEPAEKEIINQLLEQKTQALNNKMTGEVKPEVFVAGTVLDKRYRIIGLLGKGGMGEVYKAEDTKLDQTVALKFLPNKLSKNEDALKRFIGEVKTARQVAHENVCKVFDIGEIDGKSYLSMEFIEGDDLSQLLNRIGRLPSDKAVEISRQICLGLNAIHKTGILHRDLKPANIIIDSKGKARITDFGIAGFEQDVQGAESRVGTPAYMSPEQISGREVSQKSDVYSLGLLIYEIFTGKQAVTGDSIDELIEIHQSQTPTNPSKFVEHIDPLVEKVINRCLEKNPYDRPDSALQVALALPGGNPLQVALEAGETPSPEMIAATPKKGALKPAVALTMSLVILAGFTLTVILHHYYKTYNIAPIKKSPEILAERAKMIVQNLGYTQNPADTNYAFGNDESYLSYVSRAKKFTNVRERLKAGQPFQTYLTYRQSPRYLKPVSNFRVSESDPPFEVSGMININLDTTGRLIKFAAVPDQVKENTAVVNTETDWKKLFDEAGLDFANFKETEPNWTPPVYANKEAAWEGTLADFEDIPIRIEAAAFNGKPVYFDIVYPWDRAERQQETESGNIGGVVFSAFLILISIGAIILARRNIKAGRGDLKGAVKLTFFVFTTGFLAFLIAVDHVTSLDEVSILSESISGNLFRAIIIGLLYIALEPLARRWWSELLISWNRLLVGEFRDPMIGRDILIGGCVGIILTLIIYLEQILPPILSNVENKVSSNFDLISLNGWMEVIGYLSISIMTNVLSGLGLLFLFFIFYLIFRNKKISIIVSGLIVFVMTIPGEIKEDWIIPVIISAFLTSIFTFVLYRFGLLATIFGLYFLVLFNSIPLRFDPNSFLFPGAIIVSAVVIGLTVFGYYTSTAGESVFSRSFLDEDRN